jgi:uncharacterized protein DUF1905/bacteriocin resistance YdeI/OmpD-like protein
MQFTAILEKSDSQLWGHYICVPVAVAQVFIAEGTKRVVCTLDDTLEFQGALMPKGGGTYFININKKRQKKLHLREGMPVQVSLKKDESKYGLPMPEELAELLKIDEEGNRLFHALTPGRQRNLLYIAGQPKTSETRIERAIVCIEHLKTNDGKIDFKRLNEEMKNAHRNE